MMDGVTPNHEGLSRLNLIQSVKMSLDRLQVDAIDLYYWHWPDPETPVEESLRTMDDLVRQGLVHYIGVSNHGVDPLQALLDLSDRKLLERIVAVQNRCNLLDGEGEPGVLAFCERNGLGFVPYSPLAQGMLSSRYAEGKTPQAGDRLVDEGSLGAKRSEKAMKVVHLLGEIARAHGKTEAQIALAWLLRHPAIPSVIPTARTVKQLQENAGASGVLLTDEEFAKLNEASSPQTGG
jgi:aryl-alcohol dehydrogenase-like predicted oxidoreductase